MSETQGSAQWQPIPLTGGAEWLALKCSQFTGRWEKSGTQPTIAEALDTHRQPTAERRAILEKVAALKRQELACEDAAAKTAAHKKVKAAKAPLDVFVYQGLFNGSSKSDEDFTEANGVFVLDFDGFESGDEAVEFKGAVIQLPFVGAAWLSPSGAGVHVLAVGPVTETAEDYKAAWEVPAAAIEKELGRPADRDKRTRNGLLSGSNDPKLTWTPWPVPFKMPETAKEPEPETPKAKPRKDGRPRRQSFATDEQLREQLSRIPNLSLQYGDWLRVIFAVKHECGEGGYSEARRWSASCEKHDERTFKSTWKGGKRTGGEVSTWGTLVHMAGGYNAKAGGKDRTYMANGGHVPKRENRADEQQTGRTKKPRFAGDLSGFLDDPEGDAAMTADTAEDLLMRIEQETALTGLIVRHKETRKNLMRVTGESGMERVHVFDGNIWRQLTAKRREGEPWAMRLMTSVVDAFVSEMHDGTGGESYRMDFEKAFTTRKASEITKAVADKCLQLSLGDVVDSSQLNIFATSGRVLAPAIGGQGAINLAKPVGAPLVTGEAMREHRITLTNLRAMPPVATFQKGKGAYTMERYANGIFAPLIERAGCWLTGTAKRIDVVVIEQSNAGKSTFADLFMRAMPGYSDFLTANHAFGTHRFTPAGFALCRHRVAWVDEADKWEREIGPDQLNPMTGSTLSLEAKGEDAVSMPRIGTMVLLCGGFPKINPDAQGMAQRLQWVMVIEDAQEMPAEDRALLMRPDAIECLRHLLYESAHKAAQSPNRWLELEVDRAKDREALFGATRHPLIQLVLDTFERVGEPRMTMDEIHRALRLDEDSGVSDHAMAGILKQAFPGIKLTQGRDKAGRRVRRWPVNVRP